MPEEITDKKSQYLNREEVRSMEKDVAKLREAEAGGVREKISQIKTGQELTIEKARLEQVQGQARERERAEAEAKKKEEELAKLREERKTAAEMSAEALARAEEEEKQKLRAQLKEAQLKEEEERKKFLEEVAEKSGEAVPEWPPMPPILPQRPIRPSPRPLPEIPTPYEMPAPPEMPIPKMPEPEIPVAAPTPKKPFKFPSIRLPKLSLPQIQLWKPRLPKFQLPKIKGYFPQKPSIFEKVWVRIIISIFILAILTIITTFWYWYLVVRGVQAPVQTPPATGSQEVALHLPAIATESMRVIEIASLDDLPGSLSQVLQEELKDGGFTRLLVKTGKEFPGLREFFKAFKVKTPENFYNNVDNDFTLFVFSSNSKNRLGFVAKTENPAPLSSILESWEATLESDSNDLFVYLGKKEPAANPAFAESTYKNNAMRCLSFAEQNFGICWALTDNYFIFTSSRQSLVKVIDKIVK